MKSNSFVIFRTLYRKSVRYQEHDLISNLNGSDKIRAYIVIDSSRIIDSH